MAKAKDKSDETLAVADTQAAETQAAETQAAETKIKLTVRGPAQGRWRAGHHFGPTPITVSVSQAQLNMIKADHVLTVLTEDRPESETTA